MKTRILFLIGIVFLRGCVPCPAGEGDKWRVTGDTARFAALSQVESGDNDFAVGGAGEISRFQIKRQNWLGGNPHDAAIALENAKAIMTVRCAQFEKAAKRPATDAEFYALWNAPSIALAGRPLPKVIAQRAERFANLAAKIEKGIQ